MTWDPVHLVAEADQLAAHLRDARCCDAVDPCGRCRILRQEVARRRYAVKVPRQRPAPGADTGR